ncbi:hypothetical protein NB311A_06633 [Nitrobacter sp. Nb-311A]|nr:hypothetical protein NB311A_06633 [Nitrobacter sp. Nb-311A]
MEFAEEVRNEANSLPPGVEQNQLQKKLRQADAAARIDEWANSAELQPPTDDRKVRVAGR